MASPAGVNSSANRAREMFKQAGPAKKAADPQSFCMRLIIFKGRRAAVVTLSTVMVILYAILINHDLTNHVPWGVTAVPIVLLGILWLLVPPTEEWEYRHWQSAPQQMERHYTEHVDV